jgi:DNA modification methylase
MSKMINTILQGNVLERTKDIESNSVQCCVTSPPYWGLRDYGTATWEGGDENCSHKRDSKASESCTTGHVNLEGSVGDGIYKSVCKRCGAVRVDNQLGLEETPEEYVENMVKVFRDIRRVLKDDGTLWLNLGDSYCGTGHKGDSKDPKHSDGRSGQKKAVNNKIQGLKPKDLVGIPWRVALALQDDGWYLRQDIIWHKPNPMPEPVTDRCTKAHEYIFLMSKSPKYYYDADALKEKATYAGESRGKSRNIDSKKMSVMDNKQYEYRNKRSVWTINTKPYKEAHFAVFPTKLPELCIRAGTKEGDTVLDPFFGSGTTGWVARELGRNYLGIELNPEYIKIAEGRFSQGVLF